ncbi:MAG: hypothetical protein GY754_22085 [bacterium]|nr:hypothetical protein [bacterium]
MKSKIITTLLLTILPVTMNFCSNNKKNEFNWKTSEIEGNVEIAGKNIVLVKEKKDHRSALIILDEKYNIIKIDYGFFRSKHLTYNEKYFCIGGEKIYTYNLIDNTFKNYDLIESKVFHVHDISIVNDKVFFDTCKNDISIGYIDLNHQKVITYESGVLLLPVYTVGNEIYARDYYTKKIYRLDSETVALEKGMRLSNMKKKKKRHTLLKPDIEMKKKIRKSIEDFI